MTRENWKVYLAMRENYAAALRAEAAEKSAMADAVDAEIRMTRRMTEPYLVPEEPKPYDPADGFRYYDPETGL